MHYVREYVQDLSWYAMFNMTKVKLGLISYADIYLFFEKGMTGRAYYSSKRISKAKNNYLKSYDPKQQSENIMYLDANNLYDYAMSKLLSTCGFKWIDT